MALAVRLVYVAVWGRGPAELFGDALDYHSYAQSLLERGRYENAQGLRASRMPGYPLFLAGLYALFGPGVLAVQLVQCVLGAATCALVFLAAAGWLGPGWGLAAGLSAAVYYDLVSPGARLLTEAPFTLLAALALYFASRRERPAAAGAAAGAAFLLRPEMLVFAPLLAALGWLKARAWKGVAAFALAFALFAAPWAARNRAVLGEAFATSAAGPYNLYRQGLPRTIHERVGGLPGLAWAPAELGELEARDFYRAKTREFYAALPLGRALRALVLNVLIFYYPFLPGFDPTLVFFLPWAAWGLWAGRRDERLRPWAAWIVYLTALHCFVAVMDSRYRQALGPALILAAFVGFKDARARLGPAFARWTAGWGAAVAAVWAAAPWVRGAVLGALR